MASMDRTTLHTPEGVSFVVHVGGLGSRFSAALIDSVLQVLLILLVQTVISGASGDSSVARILVAVWVFAIWFGYYFACEAVFKGRTLGKRITGLRVVDEHGGAITVRQAAVRNLVRLVDFLPMTYVIGITTILGSPRSQRLGDMAAGTRVIVVKKEKATVSANSNVVLTDAGRRELQSWDVVGVNRNDIGIVRQFLERRADLEPAARVHIANLYAEQLRPRVQGVHPEINNERFLELLVEAKQLRR